MVGLLSNHHAQPTHEISDDAHDALSQAHQPSGMLSAIPPAHAPRGPTPADELKGATVEPAPAEAAELQASSEPRLNKAPAIPATAPISEGRPVEAPAGAAVPSTPAHR